MPQGYTHTLRFELAQIDREGDLGIVMDSAMKMLIKCAAAVKKWHEVCS